MMNRSPHTEAELMDDMSASREAAALGAAPSRESRFPWLTVILFVLIGAAVFVGIQKRRQHGQSLARESRELAAPAVSVITPTRPKLATGLALPAEIKPFVEAPIYARANGYLKKWHVDIGQRVKAGQLLAEIDTPDLLQELRQARAQLTQAEAALALAKTTAARWEGLLKSQSVSQQEVAEKQADLALRTASLDAAQANVRRLEEVLSFDKVTAPFDGIITQRKVDVGDLTRVENPRELFRLAQIETLRVFVHVPQTLAPQIKVGQTAAVMVPELRQEFPARIVRTSGALNPDTRTLLTELELDNRQNLFMAGSFAQVRFNETGSSGELVIPSNAVLLRPEGPQVAVVDAAGKVELRHITIKRDLGSSTEIQTGLAETDRIVANPSDFLTNGMTVQVAR